MEIPSTFLGTAVSTLPKVVLGVESIPVLSKKGRSWPSLWFIPLFWSSKVDDTTIYAIGPVIIE